MLKNILLWAVVGVASAAPSKHSGPKNQLQVKTFVNGGQSFDTVSSLIIGSEAAVIVDLPLAIPQAQNLAAWVRNTTNKPLTAAFITHFHPDHYLSGAAFFEQFPDVPLYANAKAIGHMQNEVADVSVFWANVFGRENISVTPRVPIPYNYSFFTLPGDEASPIQLFTPVSSDTVDETLFWIPSISTLIAGDSVFGASFHVWVSDLLTPALTSAWLSTLDFIEKLKPKMIIPGHSVTNIGFGPSRDLQHTRKYLSSFQRQIESKGLDFYTPEEIVALFDKEFPGVAQNPLSTTPALILNFTGQEFGRGGSRFAHHVDLRSYANATELSGWRLH